jgi:hypothetical protein
MSSSLIKDYAKKQVFADENKFHFARHIIDKSVNLIQVNLNMEQYKNLQIFLWNDWSIFRSMHEKTNLTINTNLPALPLKQVVDYYGDIKNLLRTDRRVIHIEELKISICKNGYSNDGRLLIVKEAGSSNEYLVDGHHRAIAYLSLVNRAEVNYQELHCFVAEVNKISELFDTTLLLGSLRK